MVPITRVASGQQRAASDQQRAADECPGSAGLSGTPEIPTIFAGASSLSSRPSGPDLPREPAVSDANVLPYFLDRRVRSLSATHSQFECSRRIGAPSTRCYEDDMFYTREANEQRECVIISKENSTGLGHKNMSTRVARRGNFDDVMLAAMIFCCVVVSGRRSTKDQWQRSSAISRLFSPAGKHTGKYTAAELLRELVSLLQCRRAITELLRLLAGIVRRGRRVWSDSELRWRELS